MSQPSESGGSGATPQPEQDPQAAYAAQQYAAQQQWAQQQYAQQQWAQEQYARQYYPPAPYGQPLYGAAAYRFKDTGVAYLWMLLTFVGICGAQHFYLGKIGRGVLWLLTGGLLGIGLLVDLFTLPSQTRRVNAEIAAGLR